MDTHAVATRESNKTLFLQNSTVCRVRNAVVRFLSFVFHILLACLCR